MARFYATIKGNRGEASRMGTPMSGITGHIRGWNVGAAVHCEVDSQGDDVVIVDATGGSSGYGSRTIATVQKWGKGVRVTLYGKSGETTTVDF